MSTLAAANKEFGVARHTDPDTTEKAAASVYVTALEQDVR